MTTSTQTQLRRGSTAQVNAMTPALGEAVVNTTDYRIHVGDNATAGGKPQASANDVQLQKFIFATVGGTADAITLTNSPVVASLSSKLKQVFIAASNNTTTVTAAVDGLTAKTIKKMAFGALTNLVADDLVAGGVYEIIYDGTQFQITTVDNSPFDFYLAFSDISGTAASATGTHNTAIGDSSVVETGTGAVAIGNSYASGDGAVAIGIGNNSNSFGAQSSNSIAIGNLAKASSAGANDTVVGGTTNIISSSGTLNTIIGSDTSEITGTATKATVIGGSGNSLAGNFSTAVGGSSNTITSAGFTATIIGGASNTASNEYAAMIGCLLGKADKYGQEVRASGRISATGDAQSSSMIARGQTTNGTQAEIYLDGASATQRMTIASDTTWGFTIYIVARRTDADNESAFFEVKGAIDNNAGTTALVAAITKTVIARDSAAWDVDVQADNTHDALIIKVTGEAAKTINWVARSTTVETTG